MTEILINPTNNIRRAESTSVPAKVPAQTQAETSTSSAPKQVVPNLEKTAPVQDKPQNSKQADAVSSALVNNMSEISLQFRVDEETKDVTIFVIDRKSKKVIRSIPANELAKMRAGDLLKLTA